MDCSNEQPPRSYNNAPSKIPHPGKLQQMSESANNARLKVMQGPTKGLPRKTLAARAGETAKPNMAPPPGPRSSNSSVKATSIAAAPRETSLPSSISSSRPSSSTSSRNVSNTSFSSSVGPGFRPPSVQSYRFQSAHSKLKLQEPSHSLDRRNTPLEAQDEPKPKQVLGKRKGRILFSSNVHSCLESLQSPKLRTGRKLGYAPECQTRPFGGTSIRDMSISTALGTLSLGSCAPKSAPRTDPEVPFTPSQIPQLVPRVAQSASASPSKSPKKTPKPLPLFINRCTNNTIAWEPEENIGKVLRMQETLNDRIRAATADSDVFKETLAVFKTRTAELETIRAQLTSSNNVLQTDLDAVKARLTASTEALEEQKRHNNNRFEDAERQYRRDLDDVRHEAETESRRLIQEQSEKLANVRREWESILAEEKAQHEKRIQALNSEDTMNQQEAHKVLESHMVAFRKLEEELDRCKTEVARERDQNSYLRDQLATSATTNRNLEVSVKRLEGHIHFLESDNKSQSQSFADLEARMQNALRTAAEAREKLIKEETLRRRLHNQVQELKGNIRVFCRVRPSLGSDPSDTPARISYPDSGADSKEVEVMGPEEKSILGNIITKKHAFAFDRVFGPTSQNEDVFGEISQLVQSALDGYNVCIFCYGQTGSGKTFTMSATDGMIPRAVHQIYDTAKSLEGKGWNYNMEGSFVEVYNENVNDLLGKAEDFDKRRHEIRHDIQKCKTEITGIKTVDLDSPGKVEEMLGRAMKNRSVAATQANGRSSRSHSVFILKLTGENSITGEHSEGTLNLVDLAGSERLSHSGAIGERLKETQNINKSLSCLGDVIGALGQGKEGGHVPYRNSKLTYLLQFSLGGNSKTLMFVMISPLQNHLSETLTSLKFATK
ncbi:MAG: hypothetical protein Q9163_005877, partial [Psora crenata]